MSCSLLRIKPGKVRYCQIFFREKISKNHILRMCQILLIKDYLMECSVSTSGSPDWLRGVTGLGPDCVPGSWPELTLAALQFRQEPPFPVNKSAHINWLIKFSLSLPSSIDHSFILRHHLLTSNSPHNITIDFFNSLITY